MLWAMRRFLEDYRKAADPPNITTATLSDTKNINAVRFGPVRFYRVGRIVHPVKPITVLGPRP